MEDSDLYPLDNGTIIECDMFLGVVVGADLLLVCSSELPDYAPEGGTLVLHPRGPNTWMVGLRYCEDFLINREFDGKITTDWVPDYWDDQEWDDYDFTWYCDPLSGIVEAYDDYRSLSSPARIPRSDRAFACRHRWGGRRRR